MRKTGRTADLAFQPACVICSSCWVWRDCCLRDSPRTNCSSRQSVLVHSPVPRVNKPRCSQHRPGVNCHPMMFHWKATEVYHRRPVDNLLTYLLLNFNWCIDYVTNCECDPSLATIFSSSYVGCSINFSWLHCVFGHHISRALSWVCVVHVWGQKLLYVKWKKSFYNCFCV